MNVLLLGSCLFLAGFTVHWLLWRIRVPANASTSLLVVFLGILATGLAAARLVPCLSPLSPVGTWEYLHLAVFYVSLTLSYIIAYSGLEEDSPSATMVKFAALASKDGRAREEFDRIFTDDLIIGSRLQAMVQGGIAVREAGKYRLTLQGLFWQRIFWAWSRLLGLPKGG